MTDFDTSLKAIESLLKNSFKDTIVWDQKGTSLLGKYLYLKYDEDEIGLFVGYILDQESRIKASVSFIFPHPSLSMGPNENGVGKRLFYKILIRSNLKLKDNHYRIVNGRKLPAIIRTLSLKDGNIGDIKQLQFFSESIESIRQSRTMYKVLV